MSEITYLRSGDYLLPNLTLEETEARPLGKYGRMRRTFLQAHRSMLWNSLLLTGKLQAHLMEIETAAQNRLEQLMPRLAEEAGATEELKARDPLRWTGLMERLQGASRGDHPGRAGVQLSFLESPLLPGEAEQIALIDQRRAERPPLFPFPRKPWTGRCKRAATRRTCACR